MITEDPRWHVGPCALFRPFLYLVIAAPLLALVAFPTQPISAQAVDTPASTVAIGASVGVFAFLNGTRIGASGHVSRVGRGVAGINIDAWFSMQSDGPVLALDGGLFVVARSSLIKPFVKAGPGFLFHSEHTGPGGHLGLGIMIGDAPGLAVRLEGTARAYAPDDGVPVASFEVGVSRAIPSLRHR